jgi:hypothetical protein
MNPADGDSPYKSPRSTVADAADKAKTLTTPARPRVRVMRIRRAVALPA